MLGPPGAGKGTQAQRLAATMGLAHIATGDMFRANVRNETDLGKLAKTYMDQGDLVPDQVTIAMLLERLDRPDASPGSLLDGFPRTLQQAEALDAALAERSQQVDRVLLIDVGAEEVQARLGGRWSCPRDGVVYHESNNPPRIPGKCDQCGGGLVQRDDDRPEAIARRLTVYQDQTAPLIAYYQQAGKLVRINGEQSPAAVERDLQAALGAAVGGDG
ncbi:MAG: adenylate kinase [Dehalococcoidia bacterium]